MARLEGLLQEAAGGLVAILTLEGAAAVEEGRNVACIGTHSFRKGRIPREVLGRRDLQRLNCQPGKLLLESTEESERPMAMRTGF